MFLIRDIDLYLFYFVAAQARDEEEKPGPLWLSLGLDPASEHTAWEKVGKLYFKSAWEFP